VARGSNYTFLVKLRGDDGSESLAIYKPRQGEAPLWDFPRGTLYLREYVAHLVAEALGWHFVPPTAIRDGPYGVGSMQLVVPHDPRHHYLTLRNRFPEDFRRICLFDWLANNADRKAGHCLLGADGRIWGIDHGLTFHWEPKLRTVIWDFAGEPVPAALLGDVRRLLTRLEAADGFADQLRSLLSGQEVKALIERLRLILSRPVFPEPTGWAIPWPWL
jgi:uncharacterized repeat protein (TIGR03843 family)